MVATPGGILAVLSPTPLQWVEDLLFSSIESFFFLDRRPRLRFLKYIYATEKWAVGYRPIWSEF